MMLLPVIVYEIAGDIRHQWLGQREALNIELGEAAIQHALGIARAEGGQRLRIEFRDSENAGRCVIRVRVPT